MTRAKKIEAKKYIHKPEEHVEAPAYMHLDSEIEAEASACMTSRKLESSTLPVRKEAWDLAKGRKRSTGYSQ